MATITRQNFIDAVEHGLSMSDGNFSDSEQMMLRHIAQSENKIARGTFVLWDDDETEIICGCPLTTAGISGPNGPFRGRALHCFWARFDGFTADLIAPANDSLLEIKG